MKFTKLSKSLMNNSRRTPVVPLLLLGFLIIGVAVTFIELQSTKDLFGRAQTAPINVQIDAAADVHSISPYIYGTAANSDPYQKTMGASVSRWGGNQTSRSNWENNDSNAGSDWGPYCNVWQAAGASQSPGKASVDSYNANKANGAAMVLTIPVIGWVSKDGNNGNCSTGVPDTDGPAINSAGAIAGYDPTANRNNTSIPSQIKKNGPFAFPPITTDNVVYQDEWVRYLVSQFGNAASGGLKFYSFDNEYDLWSNTHRDIHPARVGYEELVRLYTQFGDAIKAVDPTAELTGPVSWGWTNYYFSPLDRGNDNYGTNADRKAHGDVPLLQYFLRQIKAHDQQVDRRTLDVLDVHYYPQAGQYSQDTSTNMQALRLRSTRELWDPTYSTESWMANTEGGPNIQVLRKLKDWINREYPGTKLGITEWNWGADGHINGGLTIADVLGIFGREDVYLANYWTTPGDNTPGYWAWRMYRNYDGNFSRFGDTSVKAQLTTATDINNISTYASKDSTTGQLKVMLINKLPSTTANVALNIANYATGSTAQVYQYSQADTTQIKRLADLTGISNTISYSLAPYSITLLVFSPSGGAVATPTHAPTAIPAASATPTPSAASTPTPTGVGKIGDFNLDGRIDITDLSMFLSHYGGTDPLYDLNKGGTVDITDLSIFLSRYGT